MKIFNNIFCRIMATAAVMLVASGCLKNDIPYPIIQAAFTAIEAEHQSGAAIIDAK